MVSGEEKRYSLNGVLFGVTTCTDKRGKSYLKGRLTFRGSGSRMRTVTALAFGKAILNVGHGFADGSVEFFGTFRSGAFHVFTGNAVGARDAPAILTGYKPSVPEADAAAPPGPATDGQAGISLAAPVSEPPATVIPAIAIPAAVIPAAPALAASPGATPAEMMPTTTGGSGSPKTEAPSIEKAPTLRTRQPSRSTTLRTTVDRADATAPDATAPDATANGGRPAGDRWVYEGGPSRAQIVHRPTAPMPAVSVLGASVIPQLMLPGLGTALDPEPGQVASHWRNQACGPGLIERKRILIARHDRSRPHRP